MKKFLIVTVLAFILTSCLGGSGGKSFKMGQDVQVAQQCIGAIDEESFDEMNRYCVRRDERGLEVMQLKGLITILDEGERGVITDSGFGMYKIRLNINDREYWCSQEFLK